MLPIAETNHMWSRLTHRIQFRVREGIASATTLNDGSHALGSWNGTREEGPFTITSRTGTVVSLLLLSALFLVLYGRVLGSMAQQWWSDPNYGHGFLVPVFAAYILWRERSRRREVPIQTSNWGLPIMLFAIGLLILGTLGSEHFTARISLLFLISGINCISGWLAGASVGRVSDRLSRLHDSVAGNHLLPVDVSIAIARFAAGRERLSRSRRAHDSRRESANSSQLSHSRSWKPAAGSGRCSHCWPLLSATSIWPSQALGNAAYWSPQQFRS